MCAFEVNYLDGLTTLTNQLLSSSFPWSIIPSPSDAHLQLHFISSKIISLPIPYQPLCKTIYFTRDSKKPRKNHKCNFRNSPSDAPFGPGRLPYMDPPNQKSASRSSSLHAYCKNV